MDVLYALYERRLKDMFEQIKKYYKMGLYNKKAVEAFVVHGDITPEQYAEITGEEYTK